MPWTDSSPTSRVFVRAVQTPLTQAIPGTGQALPTSYGATGLIGDTVNAALFNNSVSPDASAAVASTGFNTGTWTTTNEVTDATNWVSGGRALGTKAFTLSAGTQTTAGAMSFTAANTAGGGNVTISGAFGTMVYDNTIAAGNTVAKQGICFNYFGGTQSVTAGTFTIVWDATGVFKFTN